MRLRFFLACVTLLLTVSSCDGDEDERTTILTVSSKTVLRIMVPSKEESEHMVIKNNSDEVLHLPLGSIEGFYYEKGFEYKLSVKKKLLKDPPQDSGNVIYILIEVLSKEKQIAS
jgi:hypothetical protein